MATLEQLQKQWEEDPSLLSIRDKFKLPVYREQAEAFFANLSKAQIKALNYDFKFNARPQQIAPEGNWKFWLIQAGRGYGKSYSGAGWVKEMVEAAGRAGKKIEIGIIGDVYLETETKMVMPILNLWAPKDPNRPVYSSNKHLITWKNGCIGHVVQAEVPKKLRGYNFDIAWVDELAKFQYIQAFWDQLMQCVRKGETKILLTTTPARGAANRLLKEIKGGEYGICITTRGKQAENLELSPDFVSQMAAKYGGTKFGAQEIDGIMLDDVTGALWSPEIIKHKADFIKDEQDRAAKMNLALKSNWYEDYLDNSIKCIAIGFDPATTAKMTSDESGIIVTARDIYGRGIVLDDLSGKYTPLAAAKIVSDLFEKYKTKARTVVVIETNQGGDWVPTLLKNTNNRIVIETVHATKGKILRAEPIAGLYEQGKVYHLPVPPRTMNDLEFLEYQMCNYTGKVAEAMDSSDLEDRIESPDRLDAMIYGFRYLFSELFKEIKRGPIPFRFSNF